MKTLTIKQPYASLIINGIKKYEFRSWKTNYRGKLLIHAGLSTDKVFLKKIDDININYINGAIIGEVELKNCIYITSEINDSITKENSIIYENNNHINIYAWELINPIIYNKPIYIKGKLGLWNYKKD